MKVILSFHNLQYAIIGYLKYLCNHGYKTNSETSSNAASGGHLEILKYLHENGCEWDVKTCREAAKGKCPPIYFILRGVIEHMR